MPQLRGKEPTIEEMKCSSNNCLPGWHYKPPDPATKAAVYGIEDPIGFPALDGPDRVDLGNYARENVSNVKHEKGRAYFDLGLRLMLSYQHEMASKCFLACLHYCPHCALAHGLMALCHSPNYNFKGQAYYESAHHPEESQLHDLLCVFPSQQVADRHSNLAVAKIDELRKFHKAVGTNGNGKKSKKGKNRTNYAAAAMIPGTTVSSDNMLQLKGDGNENLMAVLGSATAKASDVVPDLISDVETQLIMAIRKLTCHPGLEHSLSDDIVGRPYADAMRKVYKSYPNDPEVAYCFAEALMVLNAWQLYEFPTGKPVSPDVVETRGVLETALKMHPEHAGLCHMYVHLSEMSACPEKALKACDPLRQNFPHAGHLIHMPSHIDVLVGDYDKVVKYNNIAILADERSMQVSPETAGRESFYFGYIVHNYHMAAYGAILGGFEQKAMELAYKLNQILSEKMFIEYPDLTAYLESYSALEIHVMVRFGRWDALLKLEPPKNKHLMLFRAATLKFGQAIAHAAMGNIEEAKREANNFDSLRGDPDSAHRILHNNTVESLLAVDAVMLRGEIAYREGYYDEAFKLLRKAVDMQDNLNYDEPWGKMQPIRHALAGLLLEQGHLKESEEVFRKDLEIHPKNPWSLVGLAKCLRRKLAAVTNSSSTNGSCCGGSGGGNTSSDTMSDGDDVTNENAGLLSQEIELLERQLKIQRSCELADFEVTVPCACCVLQDKQQ